MSGKTATRAPRPARRANPRRLDATPERLARAAEAGQKTERGADGLRRLLDPFDVMRSTRALAPHDPRLNDLRWLIGEALRRVHSRAELDALRAVAPDRVGADRLRPALRPAGERDRACTRATRCARRRRRSAPPPGRS